MTQMCAALREWSNGFRTPQEFSAAVFTDVYLGHMVMMNQIRQKNPNGFKAMLRRLFRAAS